jgi:hypothetical protein
MKTIEQQVVLNNLEMSEMTKKQLFSELKTIKNVKFYDWSGDEEYKVYSSNGICIAAIDINTNQVWINKNYF